MSKRKLRILKDLKAGKHLTVTDGFQIYGDTNFKDAIFVLRKTNDIRDYWSTAPSGRRYKTYYMVEEMDVV